MNQLAKSLVQTSPDGYREKQYRREEKANWKQKRIPNKYRVLSVREASLHPQILAEIGRTKSYFATGFSLPHYLTLNCLTGLQASENTPHPPWPQWSSGVQGENEIRGRDAGSTDGWLWHGGWEPAGRVAGDRLGGASGEETGPGGLGERKRQKWRQVVPEDWIRAGPQGLPSVLHFPKYPAFPFLGL